jgi:carbon-monoxide dehydrogenase large subunit
MSASAESMAQRFGSGQSVRRVEDDSLLLGQGQFTDDFRLPGEAALVFLRSPHAAAVIRSIDTSAAKQSEGVLAVLTGAELRDAGVKVMPGVAMFKRPDGSDAVSAPRWPLAIDRVYSVGEAVCAVVAESGIAARDAIDLIEIDFDPQPAVTTIEAALADGAPRVVPDSPDNVSAETRYGDAKAAAAAFEQAAHVVAIDIVNQRLAPASIEPRTVLAYPDDKDGRLTLRVSTQMPTAVRDGIASGVIGGKPEDVRVVVADVGGGFGMKTGIYPEDAVVAYAARTLKRPVKWVAERSEEMLSAVHGRDLESRAELALDKDGKVLALRVRSYGNIGATAIMTGAAIDLLIGPWVITSIYDIPLIDLHLTAVLTNTAAIGAYRGAGRPESIFLIERLMDEAATAVGMDRTEVRRRNMIKPSQMPYKNPMDQTYDSGAFESVMDQARAFADWKGFDARAAKSKAQGRLRGIGIATFLEWTGGNALEEKVKVTVAADGAIEIISATQQMGQGLVTTYKQLAVDVFGVPMDKIRIVQGDTDQANGFGSAGSRSLFTGGAAVKRTSEQVIDQAKSLAGDALEVSADDVEYRDAVFTVAGTDRSIGLFELAAKQQSRSIIVESATSAQAPSWPNGCHVCEVEIDPETGDVKVVAYASVNDVGRVVNPMIVRGQLEGGAVQGLGQALCEVVTYDPESGQLLTGSFMDYAIPRADIVHGPIRTQLDQSTPCKTNLLGVKGVGELGTIGATPAAFSAVRDALIRAGKGEAAKSLQMPLLAGKVWSVLNA